MWRVDACSTDCLQKPDIIFNFEKVYFILDEFLVGREILETSKTAVGIAIEEAETLQEKMEEYMSKPTYCTNNRDFQSCPISATPVRTLSRAMCPLKHDPSKLHCFLTRHHQCVGGNGVQLATVSACVLPARHKESLECDRKGHPGWPNPPLTRMTLGQFCAALWVFRLWPAATQLGIEPGSLVMPQALRCSTLDRCTTRKAPISTF
uniref:uncharacterized protein LOC123992254 n=1 Tax=Oncorhynchus gorbuscha TaxID=8017 RepID=UPI001EAE8499|nr:uncharacterized protein LOC123992254 [Oncorhynchus gorbuscha]